MSGSHRTACWCTTFQHRCGGARARGVAGGPGREVPGVWIDVHLLRARLEQNKDGSLLMSKLVSNSLSDMDRKTQNNLQGFTWSFCSFLFYHRGSPRILQ